MSNDPKYRDESWLREQYVEAYRTTGEIADECDCCKSTIQNWLSKFDIKTRQNVRQAADKRLADCDWLYQQHVDECQSVAQIAEECDCSQTTVRRWLNRHGIDSRGVERRIEYQELRDPEWLRDQYLEAEKTTYEIAKEVGCGSDTVSRWLKKHDIKVDPGRYRRKYQRLTNAEWLREQYIEQGRPGDEIADEIGCGHDVVYYWLHKHEIEIQWYLTDPATGEDHHNWKGGKSRYGPGFERKRTAVRERDGYTCQDPNCSVTQKQHLDERGERLHVHHLRKARRFDDPEKRNAKENLITLCRECHRRWEKMSDAGLVPQGVVADE